MSCLFNALSYFVPNDTPELIRQRICDFLSTDGVLYDDVRCSDVTQWCEGMKLEDYVGGMRSTSTWGGAIEIKAFCEIYRKSVDVISRRPGDGDKKVASFLPSGEECCPVIQLMWTGSHYEPLPTMPVLRRVRIPERGVGLRNVASGRCA